MCVYPKVDKIKKIGNYDRGFKTNEKVPLVKVNDKIYPQYYRGRV